MNKTLEELEKELEELRKSNYDSWMRYGSELCTGDMIEQEEKLEERINKLKEEEKFNNIPKEYVESWNIDGILEIEKELEKGKLTKEEIYKIVTEKVNPVIKSLAEHRDRPSPIEEYGYNIWYVKAIRIICTHVFEETYALCNENKKQDGN
jgi:hypothetical protein